MAVSPVCLAMGNRAVESHPAIFALHRVATVGHPCLGQARARARDERVEWGLMGWGGLDHRSVRRRFSPLAGSREE